MPRATGEVLQKANGHPGLHANHRATQGVMRCKPKAQPTEERQRPARTPTRPSAESAGSAVNNSHAAGLAALAMGRDRKLDDDAIFPDFFECRIGKRFSAPREVEAMEGGAPLQWAMPSPAPVRRPT